MRKKDENESDIQSGLEASGRQPGADGAIERGAAHQIAISP